MSYFHFRTLLLLGFQNVNYNSQIMLKEGQFQHYTAYNNYLEPFFFIKEKLISKETSIN